MLILRCGFHVNTASSAANTHNSILPRLQTVTDLTLHLFLDGIWLSELVSILSFVAILALLLAAIAERGSMSLIRLSAKNLR